MASAYHALNSGADVNRGGQALLVNFNAAKALQEGLRSNLGPKGTLKCLVNGSGDIRLTKDGAVMLSEIRINHPSAALIARAVAAQDEITGDGTTTSVLLVGELLRQCTAPLEEGVHPRSLSDGFDQAKTRALEVLETLKGVCQADTTSREVLLQVARTALRTKLQGPIADQLATIVTDAVLTIRKPAEPVDLFMVEIMTMQQRLATETTLVRGLVLDHGVRAPNMSRAAKDAFIMTLNVSLEWEKTEVDSDQYYDNAADREALARNERKFIDDRVLAIIDFKRKVCADDPDKGFVVVNQKGIDPISLEMLGNAGIIALRRAKRRNMERLTKCCGGQQLNAVDNLTPDCLGHADRCWETAMGEERYFFIDGVKDPESVTILIKGPNAYTIAQIKDAVRDGLRAIKAAIEDKCVIPGGGAFEVAASLALHKLAETLAGREKFGVRAYAEALLVVPKTLATNSGFDTHDAVLALQKEHRDGHMVGLDLDTGLPMDPVAAGVYDLYRVKRQLIHSATVLCQQLLLTDEILKAGKKMNKIQQ